MSGPKSTCFRSMGRSRWPRGYRRANCTGLTPHAHDAARLANPREHPTASTVVRGAVTKKTTGVVTNFLKDCMDSSTDRWCAARDVEGEARRRHLVGLGRDVEGRIVGVRGQGGLVCAQLVDDAAGLHHAFCAHQHHVHPVDPPHAKISYFICDNARQLFNLSIRTLQYTISLLGNVTMLLAGYTCHMAKAASSKVHWENPDGQ